MSESKMVGMAENFGIPPASIQKYLTMQFREVEGEVEFIHSDVIPKSDPFLRNYIKSASIVVNHKFPGFKVTQKSLPNDEFSKINIEQRSAEVDKFSRVQSDVVQMINQCSKIGASDIHIDTHQSETIVRVRVNGELTVLQRMPKENAKAYASVIYNTLCDVAEAMYNETDFQDAVFKRRSLPANLSGVRVTCGPSINGPFMVLRLLYTENIVLDPNRNPLSQLGYNDDQVQVLDLLMTQPSGIIFVSGPTGSGKSTTLKYVINNIASDPSMSFISVEDPPEYNIANVRQMPVSVKSNDDDRDAAFAKTIRSALRSDPDRIMIGEIRDSASAVMAITCAQTGHQVWTTVHANGTFSILERMLALLIGPRYSERQAISVLSDPSIVNGLIFQRLVKVLCPHCRIPLKDNEERLTELQFASLCRSFVEDCMVYNPLTNEKDEEKTMNAVEDFVMESVFLQNRDPSNKCPHCNGGVTGRIVVSELVHTDMYILGNAMKKSIVKARRLWNNKNRYQTLQANARKLIKAGVLDPAEAISKIGLLEVDLSDREEED